MTIMSQEVPWRSLPLVLAFIKGTLFEPLKHGSFVDLMSKTVFTSGTIFTSGRDCSEGHSFSFLPPAVFSASLQWVSLSSYLVC